LPNQSAIKERITIVAAGLLYDKKRGEGDGWGEEITVNQNIDKNRL